MKYNPQTHIIGKVYDLTQENMNALLDEIDKLNLKLKELHSDSLEDHQEYKRMTYQLIKDLREENARYREALEFYANQNSWIGYHRDCTSILKDDVKAKAKEDGFDIIIGGRRAREALKGGE